MELALVATENQELRDSIHRQATPILLAVREATAAAAMATGQLILHMFPSNSSYRSFDLGPWSSEAAVSGLVSAVHHVKDLCFLMVRGILSIVCIGLIGLISTTLHVVMSLCRFLLH